MSESGQQQVGSPGEQVRDLIDAIRQQTKAIQSLADSNQALIQAMIDAEDHEDMKPGTYMDGSPV